MKISQFVSIVALATSVLFSSCKKDDDNNPNNPNNPNPATSAFFSAKVNNQSFPKAELKLTTAKFISSTKMLQIIGQPEDQKETIILNLMPFGGTVSKATDWKPGTYDFDPVHVTNLKYLASAEYNKWNSNGYDQWFTKWDYVKTGEIVIESNTGTHIKGTFSFDAVRQNNDGSFDAVNIKNITEGTFDLDLKTL